MNRGLEPWIRKWWDIANARRFRLIVKKHKKSLNVDETRELELLEAVGDAILSYVGKKNPPKGYKLFCMDCKEPLELRDTESFPTHHCPVYKRTR